MILRRHFLVFIFTLFGSLSFVQAQDCRVYFDASALRYLQNVNEIFNFYFAPGEIQTQLDTLKTYNFKLFQIDSARKRHFKRILKRVESNDFVSAKDMSKTAKELAVVLLGGRKLWGRYIGTTEEERLHEALRYQITAQLVEKGFKSFLEDHPMPEKKKWWNFIQRQLRRFWLSRAGNVVRLPTGTFPQLKSNNLPEDLLLKIIWNETEPYEKELATYFRTQRFQDKYTTLGAYYTLLYMSHLAYQGDRAYIEWREIKAHGEAVILQFQMSEFSKKLVSIIVDERAMRLQRSFILSQQQAEAQLGRKLTEEEVQQIKKIIYED